jgi:hypothetical protein
LRKYFDKFNLDKKEKLEKITTHKTYTIPVNIVFDTTFFKIVFGVMVFRVNELDVPIKDQKYSNLLHNFVASETLIKYEDCLDKLDQICHQYKSFTVDGKAGVIALLKRRYPTIPNQMCIFHQVQIVLRYTTRNPKTECGIAIKRLILTLKSTTKIDFITNFKQLLETHKEFLNEHTFNPNTGRKQYTHKSLLSALNSIKRNLPHLFTFQDYPHLHIQPTSNSCDGSFGHWKGKVKLHRGLSIERKKQMISEFLGSLEV